jgi:DNA adenine methylase
MEVYDTVKHTPREVGKRVNEMPTTEQFYYELRSQSESQLGNIQRAARFIYLNRFCFNGVYRTNRKGLFNVPRGIRTGRLPGVDMFLNWSEALEGAALVRGDFARCLARVKTGDFVYLDPPYTKQNSRYSGEYGYGSFGGGDLARLVLWLRRLHQKGAIFLLSYRYSRDLATRLEGWNIRILSVRRHVAGFLKNRRVVREMLVSNVPLPR